MRQYLISILSLFTCLFFKIRGVASIKRTKLFGSSLWTSDHSNRVSLIDSTISRSTVHVCGRNNVVKINRSSLYKTTIRMFGEGNTLQIDENAGIHLSTIVIRGNGCKIIIGQRTSFGSAYIVCMGQENSIEIGKDCMFAEEIDIWSTDSHPIHDAQGEILNKSLPIRIEDKVWVGKDCKILKGVTIHTGAVIGMGSIVTKEVKAHTLNVGNPSRCIRENISWERNFITI